jgi:hypothetical protein
VRLAAQRYLVVPSLFVVFALFLCVGFPLLLLARVCDVLLTGYCDWLKSYIKHLRLQTKNAKGTNGIGAPADQNPPG